MYVNWKFLFRYIRWLNIKCENFVYFWKIKFKLFFKKLLFKLYGNEFLKCNIVNIIVYINDI